MRTLAIEQPAVSVVDHLPAASDGVFNGDTGAVNTTGSLASEKADNRGYLCGANPFLEIGTGHGLAILRPSPR